MPSVAPERSLALPVPHSLVDIVPLDKTRVLTLTLLVESSLPDPYLMSGRGPGPKGV